MTRLVTAAALAALALVACPARAEAPSLDALFEQGNNAFWGGDYEQAVQAYARLEELGVRSPTVSYNRATAEARLGNLGLAVLHYERVLARDPGHADTVYNLAVIREFLARRASEAGRDADLAPAVGPWRTVLDRFSPRGAALAFLVFHLALFAVLLIRRVVRADFPRLTLGVLAGVLAVLTLATAAVAVGKYRQETGNPEAVVIARGVIEVMEGPASEVQRFVLDEGSRVQLLEEREGWRRLRDDQGRDGWAAPGTLGEI